MATLPVDKKQYVCLLQKFFLSFWCWFCILFVSVYVKMVYFCCVNGCKTQWYPSCSLSFHRIPKDESVAEKWKQIIAGKITKTSVVCNLQFKDQDFVNGKMGNRIPMRQRLHKTILFSNV